MKGTSVLLSAEAGDDHTAERVWDCVALNPVEAPEGDQRWEEGGRNLWSATIPQADSYLDAYVQDFGRRLLNLIFDTIRR